MSLLWCPILSFIIENLFVLVMKCGDEINEGITKEMVGWHFILITSSYCHRLTCWVVIFEK